LADGLLVFSGLLQGNTQEFEFKQLSLRLVFKYDDKS